MWVTTLKGDSINLRRVDYLRITGPDSGRDQSYSVVAVGVDNQVGRIEVAADLNREEADKLVDLLSQRADTDGVVDAGYLLDN